MSLHNACAESDRPERGHVTGFMARVPNHDVREAFAVHSQDVEVGVFGLSWITTGALKQGKVSPGIKEDVGNLENRFKPKTLSYLSLSDLTNLNTIAWQNFLALDIPVVLDSEEVVNAPDVRPFGHARRDEERRPPAVKARVFRVSVLAILSIVQDIDLNLASRSSIGQLLESPDPIFRKGRSSVSRNCADSQSMADAEKSILFSAQKFLSSRYWVSENSKLSLCFP